MIKEDNKKALNSFDNRRMPGLSILLQWLQPEYPPAADILPGRILVFPGKING